MKFLKQKTKKLPTLRKQTDIVAYRGAICNQKRCPLVHWIEGKFYAKKSPDSRDEKVIRFWAIFETEQALWLIEVLFAVKLDHGKVVYQGPKSSDENVITLLIPFETERRILLFIEVMYSIERDLLDSRQLLQNKGIDVYAYSGAVCNWES